MKSAFLVPNPIRSILATTLLLIAFECDLFCYALPKVDFSHSYSLNRFAVNDVADFCDWLPWEQVSF